MQEFVKTGAAGVHPEDQRFRWKFIFITLYALHAGTYAAWNALEDLAKNQGAGAAAAREDEARAPDR